MGRRPLLAMVAGWVAVVVAVAAITFVVVDRAGRGVGRASAAETVAIVTTPVPPQHSASRAPTTTPTPTRPPRKSTSSRPTTTADPTPSARRTTPEPDPTPPPTEPESQTASFSTDGGTVVASCQGPQISLDSIRPRDGWRFEKETEHAGLEVVFKSVEREVELHVSCQGGVPTRGDT